MLAIYIHQRCYPQYKNVDKSVEKYKNATYLALQSKIVFNLYFSWNDSKIMLHSINDYDAFVIKGIWNARFGI